MWIKTSERLPEIGSTVLAWWHERYIVVEYSDRSHQHRTIIRRDGQWWYDGAQVTHWMPLPDAPPEAS